MTLQFHNTLTRKKEAFKPADANNVRMYVCGPTVYDRPHLGNARSVVVYDVLYRLLTHIYGKDKVTYVRNITDVDDKINAAAKANGEPISALTKRVEGWFHDDMKALNCLLPTIEPRATAHIAEMIAIIEKLIANKNAYVSEGHVLFRVNSYAQYGKLSGRKQDELIAGARIEVESYKENAGDFVLWKPAEAGDDASSVFDSPWGAGRPGWHIECSAMSSKYLGDDFDIHGGGADLMFPHHENEIAQSCCAAPNSSFAKFWIHNGFLTVNGEKMSKSLGNFTTVKDVLNKGIRGEVIRFALLSAHYRSPLDWNEKLLEDSKKQLDYFYRVLAEAKLDDFNYQAHPLYKNNKDSEEFLQIIGNDLNISELISYFNHWAGISFTQKNKPVDDHSNIELRTRDYYAAKIKYWGDILGILQQNPDDWAKGFSTDYDRELRSDVKNAFDTIKNIQSLIDERIAAKKSKNWARADEIRKQLSADGIILEDRPDGTTDWRRE